MSQSEEKLTVEQGDREAAARWAKMQGRQHQAANMRRGSCDDAPLVQAFARHRLAAQSPQPDVGAGSKSAVDLAIRFHELYETLAPEYGYETRKETRAFDPESPNGRLMIAVCAALSTPAQPNPERKWACPVCSATCTSDEPAQSEVEALRARVGELERLVDICRKAIETGRSEPLFIARDEIDRDRSALAAHGGEGSAPSSAGGVK